MDILPPDINLSGYDFSVVYHEHPRQKPQIRFGLGAVKGAGKSALDAIFKAREQGGPYRDLFDFTARVDLRHLNRAVLESLIKSGAFDGIRVADGVDRGTLFHAIDMALEKGRASQKDRETGQKSIFDLFDTSASQEAKPAESDMARLLGVRKPWDEKILLESEKEALGLYMSGHPMTRYKDEAALYATTTTTGCEDCQPGKTISVAGMVEGLRERVTRSGSRMAFFFLEDTLGRMEAIVYSKTLDAYHEVFSSGRPVLVSGTLRIDEENENETPRLIVEEAVVLSEVRSQRTSQIGLKLKSGQSDPTSLDELKRILARHPGRCPVSLFVDVGGRSTVHIALPDELRTNPSDDLLSEVRSLLGDESVMLIEARRG